MSIIYTQESIFHLYRLGLVVFGRTGIKYRLSNERDMNALIRYCDHSDDPTINLQFSAFLDSLENQVLRKMQAQHLIQLRGNDLRRGA